MRRHLSVNCSPTLRLTLCASAAMQVLAASNCLIASFTLVPLLIEMRQTGEDLRGV